MIREEQGTRSKSKLACNSYSRKSSDEVREMLSAGLNPDDQLYGERANAGRRARIVAHGGVIELHGEEGSVLRRLIYQRDSSPNTHAACKRLIQEALTLGYTVYDLEFRTDQL